MRNKILFIGLCVLLVACNADKPEMEVTLHECAPMPLPRASATCFVVGNEAYVFGGRDKQDNLRHDLWKYDTATDTWDSIGEAPMIDRVNPTSCVKDGKVYVGLGFNGKHGKDSSYLKDWWEYTPATNAWKKLADYPNHYTDDATSFVGEDALYVGYGFCWNYRRDMFRYDIAKDRWDSIDVEVGMHEYPLRSFGGTGCTCNGRHFMGTGFYRFSLDWWAEFDGTHWHERTPVPGKTRTLAASAATDGFVYVSGGVHYGSVTTTGEVLKDIHRYNPQKDEWTYVAVLKEGLMNHVSFTVGKRVYVGLGENQDEQINDKLYYFEE